jgi:uncharacterized RDD family membrane protein YckC
VSTSPYAGLVSRLVALVIDGLVVTVLVLILTSLPELTWTKLSPETVPPWLYRATSALAITIPLLYFAAMWSTTGRTVGGVLTGIVVEHRDGHRLTAKHALARAFLGLLLAPFWLLGMLAILTDRHRRAWHDQLLRTDVRYTHRRAE